MFAVRGSGGDVATSRTPSKYSINAMIFLCISTSGLVLVEKEIYYKFNSPYMLVLVAWFLLLNII